MVFKPFFVPGTLVVLELICKLKAKRDLYEIIICINIFYFCLSLFIDLIIL